MLKRDSFVISLTFYLKLNFTRNFPLHNFLQSKSNNKKSMRSNSSLFSVLF